MIDNPLIWVDVETTGLDPLSHRILEVGITVTDGDLRRMDNSTMSFVFHRRPSELQMMDEVVREMHTKNKLLETVAVQPYGFDEVMADLSISDVLAGYMDAGTAPLAGSNVAFDRAFLKRYLPRTHAFAHYRNVDVSTVKELVRRWRPEILASAPEKSGNHRAVPDILESIEELRHYRRELGW